MAEAAVEEVAEEVVEEVVEEVSEAPAPEANWRDTISDPELRKVAERFNSPTDAVKSVVDLRKRESNSIRLPGADATDEEKAAYRKALGVPDAPEGYEFTVPEGHELTDGDKAFQGTFAKVFHDANLSTEQAKALNAAWNEFTVSAMTAEVEADKAFTKATEDNLRKEWADDYDRNTQMAKRAATEVFGGDMEAASQIQMKDGRFLLDHPLMIKAFAEVGKEMSEGRIGPNIGESERSSLSEQAADLQAKKMAALNSGDRALASKLDAEQRTIYERLGSEPIVGSDGRTA